MKRKLKEKFLTEATLSEVKQFVNANFPQLDERAKAVMNQICLKVGIEENKNPMITFFKELGTEVKWSSDDLAAINNLYADSFIKAYDLRRNRESNKIIWNKSLYNRPYLDIEFIVTKYFHFENDFEDYIDDLKTREDLDLNVQKIKDDIFFDKNKVKDKNLIQEGLTNLEMQKISDYRQNGKDRDTFITKRSLKKALEDSGVKINDSQLNQILDRLQD